MSTYGSKAQVYHGTCKKTRGGLTRKMLVMNKHGRIVSKKQQAAGRKAIKRLFAAGYKPTKGKFTLMRKSSRRSTRKRGGFAGGIPDLSKLGATVSSLGK